MAVLAAGVVAALGAAVSRPSAARSAAGQTWPAFVLVAGLLLIGLVAAEDGLFAAAGERLGSATRSGWIVYAGLVALVLAVTAVLNLDTSVAFLTPVAVHTARRRGDSTPILVSACLLLSNAGSLLLPGSNLTNLIVLGHLHLSGGRFAERMALPWVAAGLITAAVVAAAGRAELRRPAESGSGASRPSRGLGLPCVAAAATLMLTLGNPAPEVAGVGAVAAAGYVVAGRLTTARALEVLGPRVLLGLFGLSVGLGALGRSWTFPSHALSHLDSWATAAAAAVVAVTINNLPAAALLSARPPSHPFSLLLGLDVGPNLFVSGSLAWVLWIGAAKSAGGRADVASTVKLGLVTAPLAIAAAVAMLVVVGAVS